MIRKKFRQVPVITMGVILGLVTGCDTRGPAPAVVTVSDMVSDKPIVQNQKEIERLRVAFGAHRTEYVNAMKCSLESGYSVVAILGTGRVFDGDPREYTRVLILIDSPLDLDDYFFKSEDLRRDVEAAMGESFWVDESGEIVAADAPYDAPPPGCGVVVEWFVDSSETTAMLTFGGDAVLRVPLR